MEWINRSNDFATLKSEEWINKSTVDLLFVDGIAEGEALREIAIRQRELPIADHIMSREEVPEMLRRAEAEVYKREYKDAAKRHNYEALKDKKFTVNIKDKRVDRRGAEIVDKINEVYTEMFGGLYELISGKEGALEPYTIGYYDKEGQKNPIIDYKKIIGEMLVNYKPNEVKTFSVQSYSSRSEMIVLDINNEEYLLYPVVAIALAEELKKMADKKSAPIPITSKRVVLN